MSARNDRLAARRPLRATGGFTLIEVVCAIAVISVIFLAGTGLLGRLLVTQTANQQRTLAGAAAMLLADWHANRAVHQAPAALDLIANCAGPAGILVERSSPEAVPWQHLACHGGADFTPTGPDADRVFSFAAAATDSLTGATLDLGAYRSLLVTISPASGVEADSHMTFRQVTFWFIPPPALAAVAGTSIPIATQNAQFLGRYLLPDRYAP